MALLPVVIPVAATGGDLHAARRAMGIACSERRERHGGAAASLVVVVLVLGPAALIL
jgi:hypothetical protein